MALLNESLLTTFPDSLVCKGVRFDCIAPPVEILKKMTANAYDRNATADFQMRQSDCIEAGITTRTEIQHDTAIVDEKGVPLTLKFSVISIFTDANDSLTRLRCELKQ